MPKVPALKARFIPEPFLSRQASLPGAGGALSRAFSARSRCGYNPGAVPQADIRRAPLALNKYPVRDSFRSCFSSLSLCSEYPRNPRLNRSQFYARPR